MMNCHNSVSCEYNVMPSPSFSRLVAKGFELLLHLAVNLNLFGCLYLLSACNLLALIVCCALDLSSLFQSAGRVSTFTFCKVNTNFAMTSWYFQPNSWLRRPTAQYLRPGWRRRTRRACGTTTRFCLSYGAGTPSNAFRRARAAAPRLVL
jgi:hypothetical protein